MAGRTISKLARAANVSVETVRYYQRTGLLEKPDSHAANGYHYYSDDDLQRLRFIKKTQALGFSLHEIKHLLDIRAHNQDPCSVVNRIAREKIRAIESQINLLQDNIDRLAGLADHCTKKKDGCEILDTLWHENQTQGRPASDKKATSAG